MLARPLLIALLMCLLTAPVWAATRVVSPGGSGSACTAGAPCSLNTARGQATAGDTITLDDGTYSAVDITCGGAGGNASNGTAGGRITLKATNERKAVFPSNGGADAVRVSNCSYWNIEGLTATSNDLSSSAGDIVNCSNCSFVTFRRLLLARNNRYFNTALLFINGGHHNLVEESEFYQFHRHAILNWNSNDNTYRRNYCNSRGYADVGGGYASYYTSRGEACVTPYTGARNIMENNISEGNGAAMDIVGDHVLNMVDDNKVLGHLSLNDNISVLVASRNTTDVPHNTLIQDLVSVNPSAEGGGLYARGTLNTQCKHCSVFNSGWNGLTSDAGEVPIAGSLFVESSLVLGSHDIGVAFSGLSTWGANFTNAFGNSTANYSPNDARITNSTTITSGMGACYAWVPDGSPMKFAGLGGTDKGATVLYRYQDGVLTSTPLWDQNSGKFPCGAAVSGINTSAGNSCFDVHERLHINTGGCAFPAGYGTVTPPPTPIGNFATFTFDENSGLTAGDSSGQSHNMTLSSAGWGAPIIGVASLATNGSRFASFPLVAGLVPSTTVGLVGWWNGTTPATCDMISLGDSAVVRLNSDGTVGGFFYNGTGWPTVNSSPVNLYDGQNHMVWMTKSPTEMRVGVDTATLNTLPVTGTMSYLPGSQATIGKHGNGSGGFTCPTGRIDMVRFFDTELTPTAIVNLYNEQVPSAGLSVTHVGWFAANAPEGVSVGAIDTNLNQLISAPVGIRWSIHKADAGTLTEYFRPFCRVFSALGALMLDWTEITNSFGSTGIRLYGDSVVSTGTPTSVLLPTDGFTGSPGLYVENPADITSPYDAAQRLTLNQAGHEELEVKIEFGSPRVPGERVECRPQRENGTPFTSYMGSLP